MRTATVDVERATDYATARDLARIYRVPLGTIYRWASQDTWRRTRYRPIRYHRDDAQNSYDQRKLTNPVTCGEDSEL